MAYYVLDDFRGGWDTRKSPIAAPAGTLRALKNAHVTPGGEVEKRLAFAPWMTLPAGTVGLVGDGDTAYVFGSGNVSLPQSGGINIKYVKLTTNDGGTVAYLLDWELFDGKVYVVIMTSNGAIEHHFDGAYVSGAVGRYIETYRNKMYSINAGNLHFSATGNPSDWNGTGSGFINLGTEDSASGTLLGLEIYYDQLAVMSRYTTQFWTVDADPANNQLVQTLRSTGTYAPLSPRQYGTGDVLYLDTSGLRSLQARNSSNAASVSDVGSPIDLVIEELYRERTEGYLATGLSVIEPRTGRYWFILPDRILVLSNFPGPRVTAWSEYIPEFRIQHVDVVGSQIVIRDDSNNLYCYGGQDGKTYDACPVEVTTPLMSMDTPASYKDFQGLDFGVRGVWGIQVAMDNESVVWESAGTITRSTFMDGRLPIAGYSTHLALKLTTTEPGAATLANAVIHYEGGHAD